MALAISAQELHRMTGLVIYPRSVTQYNETIFFLARRGRLKLLGVASEQDHLIAQYVGEVHPLRLGIRGEQCVNLRLCPTSHANAVVLRQALPFTSPQVVGVRKSAGCGDRLGLATPGHVRAMRKALCPDSLHSPQAATQTSSHEQIGIMPIFAQQSIREMDRTGRTPDQVMDDATWGAFQEGWTQGFGADADHLKSVADMDACVDAGYVMYTVDPGAHVDDTAAMASPSEWAQRVEILPWNTLESSPQAMRAMYLSRAFDLGGFSLAFSERELLLAAAKYGRAVAHTVTMYRHLAARMAGQPFELEMSVDETATPTSAHEHLFVASELQRLGVRWVSLAPRFVGRFEKGVDYIGDRAQFRADLIRHHAIAQALGPYKLSIHSGSDKFSIYPIIAEVAGDLVHLKTAGTSYLEALRTVATLDPPLFREILAFAKDRYPVDRATYHVSAETSALPEAQTLTDHELAAILDTFAGRQVLHVTFGSVLNACHASGDYLFRNRLLEVLATNEDAYYALLENHIARHVAPFAGKEHTS